MAVVNLSKNEKVNLSKMRNGLKNVIVGLGWDPADPNKEIAVEVPNGKPGFFGSLFGSKPANGTKTITRKIGDIDCDAYVIQCKQGRALSNAKPVCYYNLTNNNNSIRHMGDNLTGAGEGDDEQILINLDKLPSEVDEIIVAVTIYNGKDRHQSFGLIDNAFIRIVDADTNKELCKYDLTNMENAKDYVTFNFGSLLKTGDEWEFKAIGEADTATSIGEFYKYCM